MTFYVCLWEMFLPYLFLDCIYPSSKYIFFLQNTTNFFLCLKGDLRYETERELEELLHQWVHAAISPAIAYFIFFCLGFIYPAQFAMICFFPCFLYLFLEYINSSFDSHWLTYIFLMKKISEIGNVTDSQRPPCQNADCW